jgi:hypothetical protein
LGRDCDTGAFDTGGLLEAPILRKRTGVFGGIGARDSQKFTSTDHASISCNGPCNGFRGRLPPWNGAHTFPALSSREATSGTTLFWADGRQIQKSSGSRKRQDAVRLRDQLLGKKFAESLAMLPPRRSPAGNFSTIFWKMLGPALKHRLKKSPVWCRGQYQTVFRPQQSNKRDHRCAEGVSA